MISNSPIHQVTFLAIIFSVSLSMAQDSEYKEIEFDSLDGLKITADLYMKHDDKATPFIVLCHQARFSRGEYRNIAPKLNELGFNCMAIDQRSGQGVDKVTNETAKRATKENKPTNFVDAEQDMVAALRYAQKNFAKGKLILWGSSYSSSLAIRIAGEHIDLIDGALSFAPGEYFRRGGKPANWIAQSAAKAKCPIFITSGKNEFRQWQKIFDAINADGKTKFLPKTQGIHGSKALWESTTEHKEYWQATESFLKQFQ